jgi:hypothetical protein
MLFDANLKMYCHLEHCCIDIRVICIDRYSTRNYERDLDQKSEKSNSIGVSAIAEITPRPNASSVNEDKNIPPM